MTQFYGIQLQWSCNECDGLDLIDADTIMGIDVTVFEGICYIYDNGDLYTEPIGNDDCYSLSENNVWVGFGNEYICDDNEDVLLLLLNQNTLDETELQMIDDAGGPCNYVIPMAIGDPLIQNLCCETLSNTDPLSGVVFSGAYMVALMQMLTLTRMPSGSENLGLDLRMKMHPVYPYRLSAKVVSITFTGFTDGASAEIYFQI